MPAFQDKHKSALPSPRKIRRGCSKELYRTVKRMKTYIPEAKIKEGEDIYYRKVIGNLLWIHENSSNRKVLANWWDEQVSGELAALWEVDRTKLCEAFRDAFGG
ncbi:dehydrogenase [Paenibacillus sp. SN-8-1]|uniref:dehydrogenase n=1 Tax=Paenibacillus sp. SN-8-1 TaxID=3435409 RepID=UPI003D9A630C